jgi:hypothetical protein
VAVWKRVKARCGRRNEEGTGRSWMRGTAHRLNLSAQESVVRLAGLVYNICYPYENDGFKWRAEHKLLALRANQTLLLKKS